MKLSGAKQAKEENPHYYYTLTRLYPSEEIPSQFQNQIEKDIPRTFPSDLFYQKDNTRKKISNILLAFSRRNSSIGYYQGFNYIVGILLKYIENEEETFWLFTMIMENILPFNFYYYTIGAITECKIIQRVLNVKLKELMKFIGTFDKDNEFFNNVLLRWLLSLFTLFYKSENVISFFFDNLLLKGMSAIYKFIFTLLKVNEEKILMCDSFDELNLCFKSIEEEKLSREVMSYYMNVKIYKEIDNNKLDNERNLIIKDEYKTVKENNELFYKDLKKDGKRVCNENWPYCAYNQKNFDLQGFENVYYSVLRIQCPMIVEEFYSENGIKKVERKERSKSIVKIKEEIKQFKMEQYSKVLIERKVHKCKGKNLRRSTM